MSVLVSVHVPKAGGVSMTRMLRNAFGEAFQTDYAENPAHPLSPRVLDPAGYMSRKQTIPEGVQCLHGHFHPAKYAFDQRAFFVYSAETPGRQHHIDFLFLEANASARRARARVFFDK